MQLLIKLYNKTHFSLVMHYKNISKDSLAILTKTYFFPQGYWLPSYKLECSWAMGLHICMMYNSLESAVVLLQNGAAVNKKPNGKTPLHVACTVSNSDCAGLLLEWGARINSMSLSGHAPLHYCVTQESLDCAKLLILKGLLMSILHFNNLSICYISVACMNVKLNHINADYISRNLMH